MFLFEFDCKNVIDFRFFTYFFSCKFAGKLDTEAVQKLKKLTNFLIWYKRKNRNAQLLIHMKFVQRKIYRLSLSNA